MIVKQAVAWALTPEHLQAVHDWRRQPTTVAGIATITGALSAWSAGQLTGHQLLLPMLGGLMAMVLPDNANRKVSQVPEAVATAQQQTGT